jgi:hypothetical protein
MPRPPLPIRRVNGQAIEVAAGVRLERMHHGLGTTIRFDDRMNVIRSHMRRQQTPPSMQTNFAQHLEYDRPAAFIKTIS